MQPQLDPALAAPYKSPSQRIRILTEHWVLSQAFCPSCGSPLQHARNNTPVLDFLCPQCREAFELKSTKNHFGPKVTDGAYQSMLQRLSANDNPSFFFLGYDRLIVTDFFVIPKHFFTPAIIEKRKPLSATARRAGWTGCNILLQDIPRTGRIYYIKEARPSPRQEVLALWQKTLFLREQAKPAEKGWILDVMNCLDRLGKRDFALDDVYAFTDTLQAKHPGNRHVKDKIRQQLQFLRDKGYLKFLGQGHYRLA
jgi:type II restriction enzyme